MQASGCTAQQCVLQEQTETRSSQGSPSEGSGYSYGITVLWIPQAPSRVEKKVWRSAFKKADETPDAKDEDQSNTSKEKYERETS